VFVIVPVGVLLCDIDIVEEAVIVGVPVLVAEREEDMVGDDDAPLPRPTVKEQLPEEVAPLY
jgi:hypothetical protein